MEMNTEQDVLNYFENLKILKEPNKRDSWGIFVNGNRIILSNGKSVWNKKNHASSALRNEIDRYIKPRWNFVKKQYEGCFTWGGSEQSRAYEKHLNTLTSVDELYDKMKEEGTIEFKQV